MLEVLLIRHGQTDWNAQRRVMGDHPVELNETGRNQILTLAELLKLYPLDKIYTSPLIRARQTAEILSGGRKTPVELVHEIREIEYGDWIGKTFTEIRQTPGHVDPFLSPHLPVTTGGESLEEVRHRAVSFIEKLRGEITEGRALLVSHADCIKTVLLHYLKIPLTQMRQFRIDNASLSYLTFESDHERVLAINHTVGFQDLFISRVGI